MQKFRFDDVRRIIVGILTIHTAPAGLIYELERADTYKILLGALAEANAVGVDILPGLWVRFVPYTVLRGAGVAKWRYSDYNDNVDDLFDILSNVAKYHPDGFTYDLEENAAYQGPGRYIAAYQATQNGYNAFGLFNAIYITPQPPPVLLVGGLIPVLACTTMTVAGPSMIVLRPLNLPLIINNWQFSTAKPGKVYIYNHLKIRQICIKQKQLSGG